MAAKPLALALLAIYTRIKLLDRCAKGCDLTIREESSDCGKIWAWPRSAGYRELLPGDPGGPLEKLEAAIDLWGALRFIATITGHIPWRLQRLRSRCSTQESVYSEAAGVLSSKFGNESSLSPQLIARASDLVSNDHSSMDTNCPPRLTNCRFDYADPFHQTSWLD